MRLPVSKEDYSDGLPKICPDCHIGQLYISMYRYDGLGFEEVCGHCGVRKIPVLKDGSRFHWTPCYVRATLRIDGRTKTVEADKIEVKE